MKIKVIGFVGMICLRRRLSIEGNGVIGWKILQPSFR